MKLFEVTDYNLKSQTILNESWTTLTESQRIYIGRWEKELWPLIESYVKLSEATLTPAQIQQIFQSAEEVAVAGGDNKTALGKAGSAAAAVGKGAVAAAKLPIDMAKKIDAKINELGRMAQNAGPIKNADQKFDQLKKDILAKNNDSKIVQGIQKVSDWAKENPGKASLAVGILTTLAAFAGGPAGGAAAGLIFRATKDLLQGEKLSTAVGKSVKTGVYGFLAGKAFQYISDNIVDNIASAGDAELAAMEQSFKDANYESLRDLEFADAGVDPAAFDGASKIAMDGNINAFRYSYNTVLTPDQMSTFDSFEAALSGTKTFSPEYYAKAAEFHDWMAGVQNNPENIKLTGLWNALKEIPRDMLLDDQIADILTKSDSIDATIKGISTASSAIGSAVQGAIQASQDTAKNAQQAKPVDAETKAELEASAEKKESLSMEEKYELYLQEGPIDALKKAGSAIKGAAGKAASAVGAKAAAVGKELGSKVTVAKLMKQWKSMGEPTDSGSIMNILQDVGMSNDQIGQISQAAKVDLSSTSTDAGADASTAATDASAGQQSAAGAAASKAAPGAAKSAAKGTAGATVDLQSLADEIKKAGPEVIDAVKALLSTGAATRTGGKVAGKLSTNPRAVARRQATAAKRAADAGLSVSKPGATPAAQPAAVPATKAKAPAKAAKPKYKAAPKATTAPAV